MSSSLRRRSPASKKLEETEVQEQQQETPLHEEETPACANHNVSSIHIFTIVLLDLVFFTITFCREYRMQGEERAQMTISHFIATLPAINFSILAFTSTHFLHWFDLFRLLECAQIGALTFQLWWFGADGSSSLMTMLRFLALVVRALHAVLGVVKHFPNAELNPLSLPDGHIFPLQTEIKELFSFLLSVPSPKSSDLLTGLFFILFANAAASTHNAFGNTKVLGPLTQFQAGDSLTIFVKMFVFDRLIGASGGVGTNNMMKRAFVYFFFAVTLLVQWPFMITMFSEAPFPYAHIVAELGCLWSAYERISFNH